MKDTPPRPAWIAPLRWTVRLPSRILYGLAARLEALRFDEGEYPDSELTYLWLLVLASDPDGTWHTWPSVVRRTRFDTSTRG